MADPVDNYSAVKAAAAATRPSLIIDASLYVRLLGLAEKMHERAPDVAADLVGEIERADLCSVGQRIAWEVSDGHTRPIEVPNVRRAG
jgi:hypothetical protein